MVKVKWVLVKDPDGELEPVLLACTDTELSAEEIVSFFVRRWQVEVTFAEVRRHLGVESQRQWSDLAIERSTPCLMVPDVYRLPDGKHLASAPSNTT
ncbi:MAG: hypothetical protein H6573_26125 [Lewinellaceae bacterium]|nr:hypothetical protein [Lewinellaceae bacterium]